MRIFPAIDLRNSKVVRLFQGDYDKMTVYSENPLEIAHGFAKTGARDLHVVDLDGALEGEPVNLNVVKELVENSGLDVQIGGGIRTQKRIEDYLNIGVKRVILGTVAVENFDFTAKMTEYYKEKIAVGVDTKDGFVATRGWKNITDVEGVEFSRKLCDIGVKTIICTDISRDGAQTGTNLQLYRQLSQISGLNIVASGGVGSIDELEVLNDMGVWGAIIGKALYTGDIDLASAVSVMKERNR